MELIKYRDQHMAEFIWFWVSEDQRQLSPSFQSEDDAKKWLENDPWDSWKSIKEFV